MIDDGYLNSLIRAINNCDCNALPTAATCYTLTERPITLRNLSAN